MFLRKTFREFEQLDDVINDIVILLRLAMRRVSKAKYPFNQLLHSFEVHLSNPFPTFYHRRLILPAPSDLRWV